MKKIKEFEINKKLLVLLIVVIVLFVILKVINTNKENTYVETKLDTNKEYVYTKYNSDTNNAYVPYINIKNSHISGINEQIVNLSSDYLTSTDKNKTVTYRYNQYKNILSVVLIFRDANEKGNLSFNFKTYVFDLKNNCKLLTNDEIINKFNTTYKDVNDSMAKTMLDKYNDEVKEGFIPAKECNYTCYVKLRGINNYIDNANYYIENNSLVVYRAFNVYSIYEEENYFTRDDFKFMID